MTVNNDITEDPIIDLSRQVDNTVFVPTDIAYDIAFNNLPFIIKASQGSKYRRQTASYKKDQFDNSPEPGEQSLTGWWLRSQTSFHNGAGIKFYEPGQDYQHVSHRFNDSRGVDVWTVGEAKLLPEVFHAWENADGINACQAFDGTHQCLVTGDGAGKLRKVVLNGNNPVANDEYTLFTGHTTQPIYSVTSDGTKYFAVCSTAVHSGSVDKTTVSDYIMYRHSTNGNQDVVIKYANGYLFFGDGKNLWLLNSAHTTASHTGPANLDSGTTLGYKTHINNYWQWTGIAGGRKFVYASGYAGGQSEIWAIPFDDATLIPDPANAFVVADMPFGEVIRSLEFYLNFLLIGTDKGVRVATVNDDGSIVYGPLLFDAEKPVTGFTTRERFAWAATAVDGHAAVVRIDLSNPFTDGTFPYAYDTEYQSDEASYCTEVFKIDERMILVVSEGGTKGELQVEHTTLKRTTGWLQTGYIRYNTVEPKFFKYINTRSDIDTGDNITLSTVNKDGTEFELLNIDPSSQNQDIGIRRPTEAQEILAFKFTLVNNSPNQTYPILNGYQIKAIPAVKRQRLIQYPLSCFNIEMDRYNNEFGYSGRATAMIKALELLEENGNFVNVTDFRNNEFYTGIIEEVSFDNESSPDKNDPGYGGLLTVTVRKL